ncbi:hypothetical protein Pcinc_004257 [Petrolisthes cinctipes]|uniref:Uncharacterized protein n=1 Tax=Petrolisthes cinctipes TaxID=88211 RepID=A0AAE1GHD9_PETCI|nr:hypothetical protein Pcinc_004257 [Petrolisthes cinctipes]
MPGVSPWREKCRSALHGNAATAQITAKETANLFTSFLKIPRRGEHGYTLFVWRISHPLLTQLCVGIISKIFASTEQDKQLGYEKEAFHQYLIFQPTYENSVTVRDKIKPRKPPPQRSCPASTSVIDALQPDADKEYEVTITTKEPTCNLAINKGT